MATPDHASVQSCCYRWHSLLERHRPNSLEWLARTTATSDADWQWRLQLVRFLRLQRQTVEPEQSS